MKKILVIDQESQVLYILMRLLQEAGYIVEIARDAREGLALFFGFQPDLVIMDLSLSEGECADLVFKLKTEECVPKIIAMSSAKKSVSGLSNLAFVALFCLDHVLEKPFSNQVVLSVVESTIGESVV